MKKTTFRHLLSLVLTVRQYVSITIYNRFRSIDLVLICVSTSFWMELLNRENISLKAFTRSPI